MINLISDTVTKPTPAMLEAMFRADVGDDVFGEDPSVNALEEKTADMFGMEKALFCPSGTMTNQIALAVHCHRLDEVICDKFSHIYKSEVAGYAANAGIGVRLLDGIHGKITAEQITTAINPDYDWLPVSRLVSLENTCNLSGGGFYNLKEIAPIRALCTERNLSLHLDGARIFNALVETKESAKDWGAMFDSISVCLSKGLGAPVGSLLLGKKDFIKKARRMRKAMGGGMRQAGFLAAAGTYALENNIERLLEDHARAKTIAETLKDLPYIKDIRPVQTNILVFDLVESVKATTFLKELEKHEIKAAAFGEHTVRFVTHLDFNDIMLEKVLNVLKKSYF